MPIPFRDFDERGEVRIYQHGILPHWRQAGCTYFVTFRQADSIPAAVLSEMKQVRYRWLHNHQIDPEVDGWKGKFAQLGKGKQRAYERLIGTRLDELLDVGNGACHLKRREIGQIVTRAVEYFHSSRVMTGDYVVMPNHVHILLRPLGNYQLEEVLHSIKSFTSNQINVALNRSGPFWQKESYDHIVRDMDQLESFQQYICRNPEKAGIKIQAWQASKACYVQE